MPMEVMEVMEVPPLGNYLVLICCRETSALVQQDCL